jgi:hypothetical protein
MIFLLFSPRARVQLPGPHVWVGFETSFGPENVLEVTYWDGGTEILGDLGAPTFILGTQPSCEEVQTLCLEGEATADTGPGRMRGHVEREATWWKTKVSKLIMPRTPPSWIPQNLLSQHHKKQIGYLDWAWPKFLTQRMVSKDQLPFKASTFWEYLFYSRKLPNYSCKHTA